MIETNSWMSSPNAMADRTCERFDTVCRANPLLDHTVCAQTLPTDITWPPMTVNAIWAERTVGWEEWSKTASAPTDWPLKGEVLRPICCPKSISILCRPTIAVDWCLRARPECTCNAYYMCRTSSSESVRRRCKSIRWGIWCEPTSGFLCTDRRCDTSRRSRHSIRDKYNICANPSTLRRTASPTFHTLLSRVWTLLAVVLRCPSLQCRTFAVFSLLFARIALSVGSAVHHFWVHSRASCTFYMCALTSRVSDRLRLIRWSKGQQRIRLRFDGCWGLEGRYDCR